MNRWGCHMFVKGSAKYSLQLTNSLDIFLLAIPAPPAVVACSIWGTHELLHVSPALLRNGRQKRI